MDPAVEETPKKDAGGREKVPWARIGTAFLAIFDITVVVVALASQDLRLLSLALGISLLITAVWLQYLARERVLRGRRTALAVVSAVLGVVSLTVLAVITIQDQRKFPVLGTFRPTIPFYDVAAGHTHQIPVGEFVIQEFTPEASCVTEVAVIPGREGFADEAIIGQLRFELMDQDEVLWTQEERALNNVATVAKVNPHVVVEPEGRYSFRITNVSDATLGLYTGERQEPGMRTFISADEGEPYPHDHDHSLSGSVKGIRC